MRLLDAAHLVRHANRIPAHDFVGAGYIQYQANGGSYHAVQLRVHWTSERVYVSWHGPVRPAD